MNNRVIADTFTLIADLLEIKGEIVYKILAYRKAADSLINLGRDAKEYWSEGRLQEIPGVGKAIAEKIDELLRTGKLEFLELLEEEIPPSLAGWLKVPGLGPKRAGVIWRELGITTLPELEKAAREGKLRMLPGMGEKSEEQLLAGIESLARRSARIPLGRAWPLAQEILTALRKLPEVMTAEPAGSLRRMRTTVGDLDILVAALKPEAVMDAFVSLPGVSRIVSKGETKSSVEFNDGTRAQLWIHPPERFGTALQYATGSKDHNVHLRELALELGLSLSEHALTHTDGSGEVLCATEQQVYQALGLPWIPPELREDRGEIQAAQAGKLPELITVQDIHADLQTHSTWSDGKLDILALAQAARQHGITMLAITDHSVSLGVTGGLSVADYDRQRDEIMAAQRQLGDSLRLLHGSEVEIRADGTLDYPDEFLATLDVVVASLHTSLRQPREKVTRRVIQAMHNPHVDILAHPTGRLIPEREGADLDMDAVLAVAKETGVALEINAHPSRLDLDDVYARRAREMGIALSINTDAHSATDLEMLHFGVAIARRAWVSPEDVINTWSLERLLIWLRDHRVSRNRKAQPQ